MPISAFATAEASVRISWRIGAATEVVWAALVEPSKLSHWLGDVVSGSVSSEQSFTIDHGDGYECSSTVETFDVGRAMRYSWKFPDEPCTNVSWRLSPDADDTNLTLVHTGLAHLADSYLSGWMTHLMFFESVTLGSPLPASMFWAVHGTLARLNVSGRD